MTVNTFRLLGLTLALALSTMSHAQQTENSVAESTPQYINNPTPAVEQTQDSTPTTPTGEYSVVYQDKVNQIELILHKRLIDSDSRTATEDDLMIMVRSQPPKSALSHLTSIVSMASSIKNGQIPVPLRHLFGKDHHGKPAKLDPEFKNPTLEQARPLFSQWIQANASQLAPAQQPLQKVSIESNRFVLINAKKLKKTDYQLYNEIHITLQTATHAYTHKCEMLSNALDIDTWQADQYQAVNQTVQNNLQQCINDLDKSKARISTAFTAKL